MEETRREKIYLGERNLKVTRPDGECSEILVSNPAWSHSKLGFKQLLNSVTSSAPAYFGILQNAKTGTLLWEAAVFIDQAVVSSISIKSESSL